MNELSNFDINDILGKSGITIRGIYSKNVLPSKLLNGFYVINLADDKDDGTHWTCLYKYDDGLYFYYDSFGFISPTDIEDKLHKYDYNDKQKQNFNITSCGFIV